MKPSQIDNIIFNTIVQPKIAHLVETTPHPKSRSQKEQLLTEMIAELLGDIRSFLHTEEARSVEANAATINPHTYAPYLHKILSERIKTLWPY